MAFDIDPLDRMDDFEVMDGMNGMDDEWVPGEDDDDDGAIWLSWDEVLIMPEKKVLRFQPEVFPFSASGMRNHPERYM